jgi:streptogramin lyase
MGAVWVANSGGNSVTWIDAVSGETEDIPVGDRPSALSFPGRSIWVLNAGSEDVSEVDPDLKRETDTVPLPHGSGPTSMQFAGGALWVANTAAGSVTKIDPDMSTPPVDISVGPTPRNVTNDEEDGVWVVTGDASVSRIDESTHGVSDVVLDSMVVELTKTPGVVWVAITDGQVVAIDTQTLEASRLNVGGRPVAIRAGEQAVFVALADGRILSIDPSRIET